MQSTFVLQQRTLTKLDKEEKILSAQGWVASLVCVCVCMHMCAHGASYEGFKAYPWTPALSGLSSTYLTLT